MKPIQIAPSVLPVDFSRLGEAICELDEAGVDLIQWDVMDGQFVPNLTFGPDIIASTRSLTKLPFEAHLMVLTPEVMAARYVEAGCSRLIVHVEACPDLRKTLETINSLGANAAVALNPETPASAVSNVLDLVDMVLVMTVEPGFGGQSFMENQMAKVAQVRTALNSVERDIWLQVDGGISLETIEIATRAGADTFVAGSAVYKADDPAEMVRKLRLLAEKSTQQS